MTILLAALAFWVTLSVGIMLGVYIVTSEIAIRDQMRKDGIPTGELPMTGYAPADTGRTGE